MRASELQFRCVGTVVGAFLFATLLTLSLHSPSPDADVFSNDQHHAPVVEDGECAGFGRSSPLLPAPSGALSLFSLGDWGVRGLSVGSDAQMAVARGMKCAARAAPVSAVFTLGDNFYGNGVASADDPQFEFKWASVYTDAALDVPWYPALGDHDQCGDVNAQVRFSERHERWRMPSAYYEETFAFENGSAQFVFVDWVRLEGAFSRSPEDRRFGERLREDQAGEVTSEEHWEWLRRTLGKGDPTWRVVVGHRPIVSVSARNGARRRRVPGGEKDAERAARGDGDVRRGPVDQRARPHRAGGVLGDAEGSDALRDRGRGRVRPARTLAERGVAGGDGVRRRLVPRVRRAQVHRRRHHHALLGRALECASLVRDRQALEDVSGAGGIY
jgi:hypothetical protein